MLKDTGHADVCPELSKSILQEFLRAELIRLIKFEEQIATQEEDALEARLEALEVENRQLRAAARKGDWTVVQEPLEQAAALMKAGEAESAVPALGRKAAALKRQVNDVEAGLIEGDPLEQASHDLLAQNDLPKLEEFARPPVLISKVWAKTLELHTATMKGNIDALARKAIAFFGDVPITAVTKERQKEFFAWMSRLPKTHGKGHGRNRYTSEGKTVCYHEQIARADKEDAAIIEALRNTTKISRAEKRALLAERLTPRLTLTTLRRDRDALNRMFKAAVELGVPKIDALTYRDVDRILHYEVPDDDLYVRVTKAKTRKPWSEERLAALITSPLYTGSVSKHRRWQRGKVITRDAFYWVPLFVMMLGTRIEEILLLKQKDILFRNGAFCVSINSTADSPGKTKDAKRTLPLPQIMLELGFVEWWKSLPESHGVLLFPEVARRTETGDVSSAFGKRLSRILNHLDLRDFDEDFYALRKTFSSMLRAADVNDGQRQAIAGHSHGTVLNIHYTSHNTADLKKAADAADYQLQIKFSPRHGFPIIVGCGLQPNGTASVELTVGDDHQVETLTVHDDVSEQPLFVYRRTAASTSPCVRDAARRMFELLAGRHLKLPRSELKREAFEHFHALGAGAA
ncbi:tyrosine-type recombinase/integrase [Mameliella sp.]|uniref:tyrosine-type recombinase/integrase n=1 Tax=Mameliella sp. TaxID=1924940 RepID=UPI003BAC90E6